MTREELIQRAMDLHAQGANLRELFEKVFDLAKMADNHTINENEIMFEAGCRGLAGRIWYNRQKFNLNDVAHYNFVGYTQTPDALLTMMMKEFYDSFIKDMAYIKLNGPEAYEKLYLERTGRKL